MENYNNYIINKQNLINNVTEIKKCIGESVFFCAMVKANAYGHGMENVCTILKPYVNFFGVATIDEARQIREFDKTTNILIVTVIDLKHIYWCAANNVSVTVNSLSEVNYINSNLTVHGLKVHLKVNSGLNRIGFNNSAEFKKAYKMLEQNNKVITEGVFTHFATKKHDSAFIHTQHKVFKKFLKLIDTKNLIVHCCNSNATMKYKKYHHNMVRCGFAMFGWQNYTHFNFKPVLGIESKIIAVHRVEQGETIGYDRTYTATKNMKIGVVALGYADGFDRHLSNKFKVVVKNKSVSVIGLVCMDVFMVDLTNIKVEVGETVTILGKNPSAHAYARTLNTNVYDILLKFNYRRMNVVIK